MAELRVFPSALNTVCEPLHQSSWPLKHEGLWGTCMKEFTYSSHGTRKAIPTLGQLCPWKCPVLVLQVDEWAPKPV